MNGAKVYYLACGWFNLKVWNTEKKAGVSEQCLHFWGEGCNQDSAGEYSVQEGTEKSWARTEESVLDYGALPDINNVNNIMKKANT